jgi:hypothetical protein
LFTISCRHHTRYQAPSSVSSWWPNYSAAACMLLFQANRPLPCCIQFGYESMSSYEIQ